MRKFFSRIAVGTYFGLYWIIKNYCLAKDRNIQLWNLLVSIAIAVSISLVFIVLWGTLSQDR